MAREWPKRYRHLAQLIDAIRRQEVPAGVLSPGATAQVLGVTRQAVHDRVRRGTLRAWCAEGVVLIAPTEVKAEVRRKRGISDTQGELNVST